MSDYLSLLELLQDQPGYVSILAIAAFCLLVAITTLSKILFSKGRRKHGKLQEKQQSQEENLGQEEV